MVWTSDFSTGLPIRPVLVQYAYRSVSGPVRTGRAVKLANAALLSTCKTMAHAVRRGILLSEPVSTLRQKMMIHRMIRWARAAGVARSAGVGRVIRAFRPGPRGVGSTGVAGLVIAVSLALLPATAFPAQAQSPQPSRSAASHGGQLAATPAPTAPAPAATSGSTASPAAEGATGLPLPRFVSLRSDQVNMRAGPGARYPVDWVYMRRDLPVEVIQEYETWRKIRDPDGAEGWVHQSMLAGRRTVMVRKDKVMLRRTADDTATAAAWLSQGVIGKLLQCPRDSEYCRIEVEGYQGWLRRSELWGAYKAEAVN